MPVTMSNHLLIGVSSKPTGVLHRAKSSLDALTCADASGAAASCKAHMADGHCLNSASVMLGMCKVRTWWEGARHT